MAFLRLSNRRVAARKSERKRADRKSLADERDAWLAQRQAEARNPQAVMLGKTFATKRKAAEYGKRLLEGFSDEYARKPETVVVKVNGHVQKTVFHGPAGSHVSGSYKARGKASMHVDKHSAGAASGAVRVRPVTPEGSPQGCGIWRRYVEAADQAWRWVSDHASMEDALAAARPLNNPE